MAVYTLMPDLYALDLFALKQPLIFDYNHRLTGSVKENGSVSPNRRVSVFDQKQLFLIDVATTDVAGLFELIGIPKNYDGSSLTVIITDQTGTYNALIADNVKLVGIGETR